MSHENKTLDLDIKNYTRDDLESFFKLNTNPEYSYEEIEYNEVKIRQQLLSSGHINNSMKRDLVAFLTAAKQKLADLKRNVLQSHLGRPTILPVNSKLDTTEYISPLHQSRHNELNIRENTNFMHVQHTDFLPGKVNPIHTRVISKCLNIDTRFRTNYDTTQSSDFNFHMPVLMNRVVSMQMSSFEIPINFYGISQSLGNNYLNLFVKYYTPPDTKTIYTKSYQIIVPDANYNAGGLINLLNLDLSNCGVSFFQQLKFLVGLDTYAISAGSGTGLTYLFYQHDTTTTSIAVSFELNFLLDINKELDNRDYTTKLGWNLGFSKPQYIFDNSNTIIPIYSYGFPNTVTTPQQSVEFLSNGIITGGSEMVIEPAGIRYIYLSVQDYNSSVNDIFVSAFANSIMMPDIIARIPIKGSSFSLLMENDLSVVSEPRIYFGPVDIQRIRVRLYDDRGNILDMNNANFSFSLVFKILYDL